MTAVGIITGVARCRHNVVAIKSHFRLISTQPLFSDAKNRMWVLVHIIYVCALRMFKRTVKGIVLIFYARGYQSNVIDSTCR